jgi:hypothetical protein
VLVDATRGLCSGDKQLLRFLAKVSIDSQIYQQTTSTDSLSKQKHISWTIVLTKSDLLTSTELIHSMQIIADDVQSYVQRPIPTVGDNQAVDTSLVMAQQK